MYALIARTDPFTRHMIQCNYNDTTSFLASVVAILYVETKKTLLPLVAKRRPTAYKLVSWHECGSECKHM